MVHNGTPAEEVFPNRRYNGDDPFFEELEADTRIQNVYVSTNASFAEEFEPCLADRPYEKPTLSIEETSQENETLGVVGALPQLVGREGLSEETLIIAGDNYISFGVGDFIDHFDSHGTPTIATYDVGVVEVLETAVMSSGS